MPRHATADVAGTRSLVRLSLDSTNNTCMCSTIMPKESLCMEHCISL